MINFFFLKKQNYSKISPVRYLSPPYMLVPTKIKKWVGSPSNYLKEGYIYIYIYIYNY
jgi:hypothetical protein